MFEQIALTIGLIQLIPTPAQTQPSNLTVEIHNTSSQTKPVEITYEYNARILIPSFFAQTDPGSCSTKKCITYNAGKINPTVRHTFQAPQLEYGRFTWEPKHITRIVSVCGRPIAAGSNYIELTD